MQWFYRILIAPVLAVACVAPVAAQRPSDAATRIAEQKAALARLSYLDGIWRGPARGIGPDGRQFAITQTERVGPLLDGTIKLIEGLGYNADGSTGFNAFAVLSWDASAKKYRFQTYAMGNSGEFAFEPTADGYVWKIFAGPATMVYTATIKDGTWHQVGDRLQDGKSVRFFEMTLKRVGDSPWPAAGTVPMR